MSVSYGLERIIGMSIIEENAKTIKDWLKHLDFEHEHPGYGKDVYKKLDEIITEAQKIKED